MGRRKTYDRKDALRKAMLLFWERGFEGAHLSQLVEVTGLNRFALYKEFEGKSGLFEEALALYLHETTEYYKTSLTRTPFGLENIKDYFEKIQFTPGYHGCFLVNSLTEQAVIPPTAFQNIQRIIEEIRTLFLENITAAQNRNQITPTISANLIADTLMILDQGLSIYGIHRPDTPMKNQVIESYFRTICL